MNIENYEKSHSPASPRVFISHGLDCVANCEKSDARIATIGLYQFIARLSATGTMRKSAPLNYTHAKGSKRRCTYSTLGSTFGP